MQDVHYKDRWVELPQGRIFTRTWRPNSPDDGLTGKSPIVLFHDSLGSVELWRGFPASLSAGTGRIVIAYDRLGFGKSDGRKELPGLNFIAEEATAFFPEIRRQLGFTRFIAFGHSVGGGMAINCAAAFPDTCDALITESAQVFAEDRTLQAISLAKEQFKADAQIERLQKYHGDKAEWVLDAWTGTWLNPEFIKWSLEPVLPLVTSPLLAIHGSLDEYGSNRHPETMGRLTSGRSRIEIIPDTHHVPHREHEQFIVQLVTEFLASIR